MRRWLPLGILLVLAVGAALWLLGPSAPPETAPVPEVAPEPARVTRTRRVPLPMPPHRSADIDPTLGDEEVVEAYLAVSEALGQGVVSCALPEGIRADQVSLQGLIRQWEEGDRILGFTPHSEGAGRVYGTEPEYAYQYSGAAPGTVVTCQTQPTSEVEVRVPVTWDPWDHQPAFVLLSRSLGYVRGTCLEQRVRQPDDYGSGFAELSVVLYENVPCTVTLGDTHLRVTHTGAQPASVHFDSSGRSSQNAGPEEAPTPDPERFEIALENPDLSPAARRVVEALAEEEAALAEKVERQRSYHDNRSRQMQEEWRQRVLQQGPGG